MKVYMGICLEDYTLEDQEGNKLELERGKEYTLSHEKDGQRCVFSNYWAWVPAALFGGIQPLSR